MNNKICEALNREIKYITQVYNTSTHEEITYFIWKNLGTVLLLKATTTSMAKSINQSINQSLCGHVTWHCVM